MIFFMVSVLKKFGIDKSIGTGFEKFWRRKSIGIGFEKIGIKKVSISEKIWYRKK